VQNALPTAKDAAWFYNKLHGMAHLKFNCIENKFKFKILTMQFTGGAPRSRLHLELGKLWPAWPAHGLAASSGPRGLFWLSRPALELEASLVQKFQLYTSLQVLAITASTRSHGQL
jgi:hypothetical protein